MDGSAEAACAWQGVSGAQRELGVGAEPREAKAAPRAPRPQSSSGVSALVRGPDAANHQGSAPPGAGAGPLQPSAGRGAGAQPWAVSARPGCVGLRRGACPPAAGLRVQPLREERRDRRLHLFHLGLPAAAGGLRAPQTRRGPRLGGGEQPVLLRLESPLHDAGGQAVRRDGLPGRGAVREGRGPRQAKPEPWLGGRLEAGSSGGSPRSSRLVTGRAGGPLPILGPRQRSPRRAARLCLLSSSAWLFWSLLTGNS